MINQYRVLAIIPARGGSKGIPNKNIYPLCGKPLLSYSLEGAQQSKYIDQIFVSTDSSTIAEVASDYGVQVPFLRDVEYAKDTTSTIDTICNDLARLSEIPDYKADIVLLLQPTSPLRTVDDIDAALELFVEKASDTNKGLVSVEETGSPLLMRSVNELGELESLIKKNSTVRRQDMDTFYRVNGAIYINWAQSIHPGLSFNDNEIAFIMSPGIDIDTIDDLYYAEYRLKEERI